MRYVKQAGIILGITMAGEVLYQVLPLPVPAGVYGLFLMLGALNSGLVKLESVEGTGNFLLDCMTMLFIPAMVGIVENFEEVKAVLFPYLIIIGISTLLVMAVTGLTAQWMMRGSGQAGASPEQMARSGADQKEAQDERKH